MIVLIKKIQMYLYRIEEDRYSIFIDKFLVPEWI